MLERLTDNPLRISGDYPVNIAVEVVNVALKHDMEQQILHFLVCRALGFMDLGISMRSEFDPKFVERLNIKPSEYDRVISELEEASGFAVDILTKSVEGFPYCGRHFSYFLKPSDLIPAERR